ncbi:hypothetical protein C0Q70_20389 [Pomacea canaliculata]|uniref:Katanin p60 ATPase-containing subunit A-like 2 n=1 Tax=Pomacea canaliculata TaxID=400727 RepID=A0A2T7NFH1_POMCA|nr:hypothetical protein C0Q70_20389 [Pomacea canaliculata]
MAHKQTMLAIPVQDDARLKQPLVLLNGDGVYLNYRRLQDLPVQLFEPDTSVAVRRIYLKHNLLHTLIGQLNHLQHLEVSNNRLEWLPSQLASCTRLQQLSLDHNILQSLPREFCHLQQLTEISASDNALVWLPLDLGQLSELQGIYVDNNPHLTAMPASTLHKNIGFFRSGREGVPEKMLKKLLSVTIHSLENEVTIALPAELRAVGNMSSDRVPLLLELSLAAAHTALCQAEKGQSLKDEIPLQLLSHLTTPTAHCQQCHRPIFVYGFPIVFRAQDGLRTDSRKKNLLILVLNYLTEEGYLESSQSLAKETNIDINRYEVCDNVDLETILMEYESYYYVKFAKYPKLTKKATQSAGEKRQVKNARLNRIPQTSRPTSPPLGILPQRPVSGRGRRNITSSTRKPSAAVAVNGPLTKEPLLSANGHGDGLALQGMTVHGATGIANMQENPAEPQMQKSRRIGQIIDVRAMLNEATRMAAEEGLGSDDRILKPLGGYVGYNSEWRELAQTISRDIYLQNPNVKWDDIIGLDEAKRLMKESVVYPVKYPQLFQGILSPWKGVLLYGPPGTGKTLLAKAVATECNTTFFNISASSIVSKWRGDSEKLVRVLFELARFHAPSTIFLDELESLMSQRWISRRGKVSVFHEHEGSRRMKTELLVQMDGLAKTDDLVFLLAASNLPWFELDHAMLRRLEKRILVDLPLMGKESHVSSSPSSSCMPRDGGLELLAELDYDVLAMKTEGYSGSDIKLVCKEAAMRPVRKIFAALENHSEGEIYM